MQGEEGKTNTSQTTSPWHPSTPVDQPPLKGADVVEKERPLSVSKDLKPDQPRQPSDKPSKDVSSKLPKSVVDLGIGGAGIAIIQVSGFPNLAKALFDSVSGGWPRHRSPNMLHAAAVALK